MLSAAGALSTAALLAGCAGTVRDSYAQPGGTVPDRYGRRTRVVLWSSFADIPGETLLALADAFNQGQRDIYVEVQFQGSYDDTFRKTVVGRLGGQVPDLVTLSDVTWGKFLIGGALQPWDELARASGLDLGVYNQHLLKEGLAKDGRNYWIPMARSTPLFYYNRTLFKKAGLPDRAPATWFEMRDWAKEFGKVRLGGNRPKMEAYYKQDGDWQFLGSCWQWGGSWSRGLDITLDSPEVAAAGAWQRRLIYRDRLSYMATDAGLDFGNQLTASVVNSTGALGKFATLAKGSGFRLGTGFVPRGHHFGVPTGGSGFCSFKGVPRERQQAAMEFIKFLARPENSAEWTVKTGYLPVVDAAVRTPKLASLMKADPNFTTSIQQLARTRNQDLARLLVPNANVKVYTGLQKIWSDDADPAKVFRQVADQLRKGMDRVRDSIEQHVRV
ncbi:hypothetical protein BIV57_10310 [Mangrovactinospora gilvigrisea]|uniref:ABC transporter substrate-binding protein n=1 Tax=Mangrovactinospora gilvigrisea TaxID=1428644 RepID=A0A1J7BFZ2_9ACTN|nr:hypothetical protein BIV57_10310 [Mangrovactinospora gilvigrisea]